MLLGEPANTVVCHSNSAKSSTMLCGRDCIARKGPAQEGPAREGPVTGCAVRNSLVLDSPVRNNTAHKARISQIFVISGVCLETASGHE